MHSRPPPSSRTAFNRLRRSSGASPLERDSSPLSHHPPLSRPHQTKQNAADGEASHFKKFKEATEGESVKAYKHMMKGEADGESMKVHKVKHMKGEADGESMKVC